ncbi:hypothetical protein BpHYR1_022396 [Brachionus plicatilis]|uniref:Uncharacterized protein n=1 Tax=Brachionus plicatilis TaxID=10195 RepID=A0A3M7RDC3_BRAPC|nr:hypothetical protein BpHYR1_022396 [Brachionus plicatilis]
MDDLKVTLPCGFSADYKEIDQYDDIFICPICLTHQVERQQCLNMNRKKLVINQTVLSLKQKNFSECRKNLEIYRNMSNDYDDNRAMFKLKIDARKELIKLFINQKIDQHFEKMEVMEAKNEENLDIKTKLDLITNDCRKIDDLIRTINSAIKNLRDKHFHNQLDTKIILKNICKRDQKSSAY